MMKEYIDNAWYNDLRKQNLIILYSIAMITLPMGYGFGNHGAISDIIALGES